MAGYCSISDVQSYGTNAGKPFDAVKPPTITQVQGFIDQTARYMDSRLRKVGVTCPVVLATSPIAYALMQDINILGAAGRTQQVSFRRAEPTKSDYGTELLAEFERRLDDLCEDPSVLSDAGGIAAANLCKSRTHDIADYDDPDDLTEHRFYRGQEW